MSEAPETIWAWDYEDVETGITHNTASAHNPAPILAIEYRRVDLPPTTAQIMADPRVQALVDKSQALLDLNDNHSPFGGEMYRDRVDRTWDNFRAALAQLKEPVK